VSISTTSGRRATAALMPSKTTADGSVPSFCRTICAPVRSAQIES
jgi:hypothetical protein